MREVKRFVSVTVMVYLLLAVLFLLFPAVRSTVAGWGSGYSPVENERNFFQVLAAIGAVVMAVQLVVENLDSGLLRRTVGQQDNRINELKAKLYDYQATTAPAPATLTTPATSAAPATSAGVAYPTAAEAARREQGGPATLPPAPGAAE